jgi:hypothetical protein
VTQLCDAPNLDGVLYVGCRNISHSDIRQYRLSGRRYQRLIQGFTRRGCFISALTFFSHRYSPTH